MGQLMNNGIKFICIIGSNNLYQERYIINKIVQLMKIIKVVFVVLLASLTLVQCLDYDEAGKGVGKIKNLIDQKKTIETQLTLTKQQLNKCLKREKDNTGSRSQECEYQRSMKERFQKQVRQLEDKFALIGSSQSSVLTKLKEKIGQLQEKLFGQSSRANRLDNQKISLSRQRNQLKTKAQQFYEKLKRLQQQAVEKGRKHIQQIGSIKDTYQRKIRQSVSLKCDEISSQTAKKYQQCQKQSRGFLDKIRNLQENAVNKAKQFGDKIVQTKNQLFGRVKNYLTGNGPYNKEDQKEFYEFKQKVSNLQRNLRQKLSEIEIINKEKEDISLQQRYCKAKLSDFNNQIDQLQKEAQAKGKSYYIREIKKLVDQKFPSDRGSKPKTDDSIIRSFQDKLAATEKKLKLEIQQNGRLYNQKKKLQQKLNSFEKQLSQLKNRGTGQQSNRSTLEQQNRSLKKLIQEIYQLRDK